MSSRRASISSASDLVQPVRDKQLGPSDETSPTCDISLSYISSAAFWSPSYDLALSTTSSTAKLCCDATLTTMTSEA
jgi:hypothetical protein